VANRIPPPPVYVLRDFKSVCDEMFDELLVARWRGRPGSSDRLAAVDHGESYQVTISTADADPNALELEVSDHSLRLRIPAWSGSVQNTCHFPHPIDSDRVTASWRDGVLQVTLPKKRGRRIAVA
jgi:HSP20 family molecular chaperone IbpA